MRKNSQGTHFESGQREGPRTEGPEGVLFERGQAHLALRRPLVWMKFHP